MCRNDDGKIFFVRQDVTEFFMMLQGVPGGGGAGCFWEMGRLTGTAEGICYWEAGRLTGAGRGYAAGRGAVDRGGINAVRGQEISVRVSENHMGNEDFSSFIVNYGYLGRIF